MATVKELLEQIETADRVIALSHKIQAVLAERERCAKIVEEFKSNGNVSDFRKDVAAAIRRGE